MGKNDKEFATQLTTQVGPATRNFILGVLLDVGPNHAAKVDFGIDSQQHYEALYYPLRAGEIMPKELDAALGHGVKLTALTLAAESNPHKEVVFHTSWDVVQGRGARPQAQSNPTYSLDELRAMGRELRHDEENARQQEGDHQKDLDHNR